MGNGVKELIQQRLIVVHEKKGKPVLNHGHLTILVPYETQINRSAMCDACAARSTRSRLAFTLEELRCWIHGQSGARDRSRFG